MLRVTTTLAHLRDFTLTDYNRLQIVRWRKPRWLPTAKSKIFRVPPRCVIPLEEKIEIQRLYNDYRNHVNSVKKYLISNYSTETLASADPEEQSRTFTQDLNRCIEINNQWNEQQRILREKRVAGELEADIQYATERLALGSLKQVKKQELVEEIVRKEKAVSFITQENIDAAIEHALANEVDYNYAIDLNGQKIVGRNNAPQQSVKQEVSVKQ